MEESQLRVSPDETCFIESERDRLKEFIGYPFYLLGTISLLSSTLLLKRCLW